MGQTIGFHAHEALAIAAQTARVAATLLLDTENHPEREDVKREDVKREGVQRSLGRSQ